MGKHSGHYPRGEPAARNGPAGSRAARYWNSATEATVVFPGRVFRYRRGDVAARQAAQEHGRRCGVPESQLDWTD
jgi:hypothetical protein